MANTPQLPERIQRELEEALRDGGVDKLPSQPKKRRRGFRPGIPDPRPRNPGELVLVGAICFVAGMILIPFRGPLLGLALACVAVAMISYLIQPHGYRPMYWRGRYLDVPTGRWQERLYRLIYRQR